jgi:hypothetical protein
VRRRRWREPERPLPGLADRGQVEPHVSVPPPVRPSIIPPEELSRVRPWDGDAHRPVPAANAWPDDAVLLTYAELRRLVAQHLDLAWQGMPNVEPWLWVRHRAKAMRDGESPLLLSEVMDTDPPPTGPPATLTR